MYASPIQEINLAASYPCNILIGPKILSKFPELHLVIVLFGVL